MEIMAVTRVVSRKTLPREMQCGVLGYMAGCRRLSQLETEWRTSRAVEIGNETQANNISNRIRRNEKILLAAAGDGITVLLEQPYRSTMCVGCVCVCVLCLIGIRLVCFA